jgi:cyclic pyranopterin phosphate synthase
MLSTLPLKKIGMTTNGVFLDRYLPDLKRDRVNHLNISLDSLNPENFHRITNGHQLIKVLKNTEAAAAMGFHVKINVVSMRGVNDQELFDFAEYAARTKTEVRFLEVMRIGYACKDQQNQFIPSEELIERLKTRYHLQRITKENDSTSFNYLLDNGAEIGFIASESRAFCGQCSRWRLSADGVMRACLLKDDGLSIKAKSPLERQQIYQTLLGMKPLLRPAEVAHQMNTIGG